MVDRTVVTAVERRAANAPDQVAIIDDDGTEMTAGALWRQVTVAATALHAAGVRPGDRVAWHGRNDPGLLVTLLAAHHLGAVFAPLSFRAPASEIGRVLGHLDPRAVVRHGLSDEVSDVVAGGGRALLDWSDIRAGDAGRPPRFTAPEDLALLMCTSGSSGRPKAVMLTHDNLWWSQRNLGQALDLRADDVALAVSPLFHIGGLNTFTLDALARGGAVVVRARFDPVRTLADLTSGVTNIFGVPAMYASVARVPGFEHCDLSGVRSAIVGGAPVGMATLAAYRERGMSVRPSWGMTETAPAGTLWTGEHPLRSCGVGRALPHLEILLADPVSGRAVTEPGTRGELTVRGPQVTPGYWRDPQATAAVLRDGWLHTADLATWDELGDLVIVGRLSEVINSGGEKIDPGEVEAALVGLDVAELAVVGVLDPAWGEVVVAVLVGEPGRVPTLDEVRGLAEVSLARYKLPKHVVVLPALPLTASGKTDRNAVRDAAADALGQPRHSCRTVATPP